MSVENHITCPSCGHSFDIETVLTEKIERSFKEKYNAAFVQERKKMQETIASEKQKLQKEQETLQLQQQNFQQVLKESLDKERIAQEKVLKTQMEGRYQQQIQQLLEQQKEDAGKLGQLLSTQIENEKLKQSLQNQEKTIRLELEQQLTENMKQKTAELVQKETEKMQLNMKEKETVISQLHAQIEEMKKKAEQGSMQLQGEAQELLLEEILKNLFPFDVIEEVGKGVRGADVIQTVHNKLGKACGKIAWESKRTKHWSNDWIKKIKEDQGRVKADVCVIVSEVLPEEVDKIAIVDGVYVCSFSDFKGLAVALRDGMQKIQQAFEGQSNKGDKMQLLYDFLMGSEFKLQMNAIVGGFRTLKEGYEKEKLAMHRIWKEREKQLDSILINTQEFLGSLEGIAGQQFLGLENGLTPE